MDKYNYKEAMVSDICSFLNNNKDLLLKSFSEIEEILWEEGCITGNGSNCYDSEICCADYLYSNLDLAMQAMNDFGFTSLPKQALDHPNQYFDSLIRCNLLAECLEEALMQMSPLKTSPIVDNIQIRPITYTPGFEPTTPTKNYDIVKWDVAPNCEYNDYCYSLGTLVWNKHTECYELHSCGLRWLEANPSAAANTMILNFCKHKMLEYENANC